MAYRRIDIHRKTLFEVAQTASAKASVSLSGGGTSALTAERVIGKYGRDNVMLWFADVQWEDEDLYRFVDDCMQRWGGSLYYYTDGRKPLQISEERKWIPNNRTAPCTYELKVKPFRQFVKAMPSMPIVCIGLDWREMHRVKKTLESYQKALPQAILEWPLLEKPYEYRDYSEVIREDWGIEPPRFYSLGFPHNNCGGRCVRQGVEEWVRLFYIFPERFAEMEQWENEQRAKGDARANHTICTMEINGVKTPITLTQIREVEVPKRKNIMDTTIPQEDRFSCFCSVA